MSMEQRKSFPFFRSFFEGAKCLSKVDRLAFYDAIIEYGLNDVEPNLKGSVQGFFEMAKPSLEKSRKLWENGCKGAEHGVKGGAPKGNQNARKQSETTANQPQNNPKTTPKENKKENKKENLKENLNNIISFNDKERAKEVVKYYNLVCKDMPKVKSINDGRYKAILDFLHEIEEAKKKDCPNLIYQAVFLAANQSSFLRGHAESQSLFKASFDWIIRNWLKIYEGCYSDD